MSPRKIPGTLVLGLVASLVARRVLCGGEHPVGGPSAEGSVLAARLRAGA